MTPKQIEALRMLNLAFESHDGSQVQQAIITQADFRLLFEALMQDNIRDAALKEAAKVVDKIAEYYSSGRSITVGATLRIAADQIRALKGKS